MNEKARLRAEKHDSRCARSAQTMYEAHQAGDRMKWIGALQVVLDNENASLFEPSNACKIAFGILATDARNAGATAQAEAWALAHAGIAGFNPVALGVLRTKCGAMGKTLAERADAELASMTTD